MRYYQLSRAGHCAHLASGGPLKSRRSSHCLNTPRTLPSVASLKHRTCALRPCRLVAAGRHQAQPPEWSRPATLSIMHASQRCAPHPRHVNVLVQGVGRSAVLVRAVVIVRAARREGRHAAADLAGAARRGAVKEARGVEAGWGNGTATMLGRALRSDPRLMCL